jgi:hypothetical protein
LNGILMLEALGAERDRVKVRTSVRRATLPPSTDRPDGRLDATSPSVSARRRSPNPMSFNPDGPTGGSQGSSRSTPRGAQGASRGGVNPDSSPDDDARPSFDPDAAYDRGGRPSSTTDDDPSGGSQSGRRPGGWRSFLGGDAKFLGLPVGLIYGLGAAIIMLVFVGSVCGAPTATGSVAGQVKQLGADRTVSTLAGAQLTLRGNGQTLTTTSTDVDPSAEGEAAYNYRFENVPPGKYALTVAPPAGATLQTEDNLDLEVKSGQLFPQSVMLLAQGIQKPRQLAQNELQPGEAGGYVDDRGQRHSYQQGSGFDASDALLMYLLWRNPPGWGYGAPPVIMPGGSSASSYRVADPPSQTRTGQAVTQQKPTTPGQGSTRPSSGSGATGSAPSRSSGSGDAVVPSTGAGSSGASSSGSNTGSSTSTQTKPSTSTGSGSSVSAPSAPSQGATRPSSSSSSPSRSSAPSRSSGSSGGGRR